MKVDEAITLMKRGEKITHRSFLDYEWITEKDGKICFENGQGCSPLAFWNLRQDSMWDDGYSLFEEPSQSEQQFKEIVDRVSKINKTLRNKNFKDWEIDRFWAKIIRLIPFIKEKGVENIKVCTGCGHLNIEPVNPPAMSCCPDSNYIPIKQQVS